MSTYSAGDRHGDPSRWRVCRVFQYKEWPEGVVLYDTASGNTLHLTPTAFQILSLLHNAPHTQEELARCVLSSGVTTTVDDEIIAMIDATLAHLAELGLIESIQH